MILNATTMLLLLHPPAGAGSGGAANADKYEPNSPTMMPCFWSLCKKYCTPGKHMVQGNLIVFSVNPTGSEFQQLLLTTIYEVTDIGVSGMIKQFDNEHPRRFYEDRAKYYLLFAHEMDEIGAQLRQLQALASWNPRARYLMFMLGKRSRTTLEKLTRPILELFKKFGAHDVMVSAESDTEKRLMVYSWLPYELDSCGRIHYIRLVDECKGIFVTPYADSAVEDKFPNDLLGCPIRVGAVATRPFVTSGRGNVDAGGVEVQLLRLIGLLHNFTADIAMSRQSRAQVGIHSNGTLSPFYEALTPEKMRSDILIGGLFETFRTRGHFGATVSYMRDDVTWLVRTSTADSKWRNVFAVYADEVWISAAGLGVVLTFVLHGFYRCQHNRSVRMSMIWTLMFNAILGLPASQTVTSKTTAFRLMFAAVLIFGLHFCTGYHSVLISVLTNKGRQSHISSSAELYESGVIMKGGLVDMWRVQENGARNAEHFEICDVTDDCLREVAYGNTEKALAVSRLHARDLIWQYDAAGDPLPVYVFPESENLYEYNVVMMVRKNYHLIDMLDSAIRKLVENGMVRKLVQDNERASGGGGRAREERHEGDVGLNLEQLTGAFLVLFVGQFLSVVIFALEFLRAGCRKIKIVVVKN